VLNGMFSSQTPDFWLIQSQCIFLCIRYLRESHFELLNHQTDLLLPSFVIH
jgi:hypothetical protein